jgi:hypothetical protein
MPASLTIRRMKPAVSKSSRQLARDKAIRCVLDVDGHDRTCGVVVAGLIAARDTVCGPENDLDTDQNGHHSRRSGEPTQPAHPIRFTLWDRSSTTR